MKPFTLYKRRFGKIIAPTEPGFRDQHWEFTFTYRRKKYARTLETTDAARAQARAKLLYTAITDAVKAGELNRLDATKTRHSHTATLAELITAYRQSPVDANPRTRESNVNALLNLLRRATAAAEIDEKQPFSKLLTAATVAQFFAVASVASDDQTATIRAKRTANSLWLQAASLCAPRALAWYKTKKIFHPCLEEFVNAGQIHRFTRLPRIEYNPPAEKIIADTLKAWAELEERNLFLAIGLELAFGLRVGEVVQARPNWFSTRHNYPVLDGEAAVKNKTGRVQVRALDPYYTTLRTKALAREWLKFDATQSEFTLPLITGSPTYRDDGLEREVSDFLRTHGWNTQKTNHALRAYAGSQVAMRYGIYEAQTWLRHSSVKVTEQHYSHFVSKFRPADLETLPAAWATAQTPFMPKILEVNSPQN